MGGNVGPKMRLCAKVKHRLVCLSDHACKAAVVVIVVYLA